MRGCASRTARRAGGAAGRRRLRTCPPVTSLLASIPSPASNGFHIGPLFFRAYGICYVFAVLAAVVITGRRWGKLGGDPTLAQECALWGFPAGLIGGGPFFLPTHWDKGPGAGGGAVALWRGGPPAWGGAARRGRGRGSGGAPPRGPTSA